MIMIIIIDIECIVKKGLCHDESILSLIQNLMANNILWIWGF